MKVYILCEHNTPSNPQITTYRTSYEYIDCFPTKKHAEEQIKDICREYIKKNNFRMTKDIESDYYIVGDHKYEIFCKSFTEDN